MGFRQPNVCSRFTIKTEFRSKVYFNFSEAIKIKIWGIAQIYLLKIQEAASFRIIYHWNQRWWQIFSNRIITTLSFSIYLQRALAERDMNSVKENADIQSESATDNMVSSSDRRRRVSSADRERAKNDDNNNVESTETPTNGHYEMAHEESADRDDRLHRMAKCPSRNTEADDEESDRKGAHGDFSKTSPLRISIGAEQEDEEEQKESLDHSNIDALSKSLHINDEIINIIANSKHLLVNGENQPQEIAAKNERVSLPFCGWAGYLSGTISIQIDPTCNSARYNTFRVVLIELLPGGTLISVV